MNSQPQIPVINENIKYLDRIIQTPPINNNELRNALNRIIQMSQEEKMEFTKEMNDIIALIKKADAIDISSSDFLNDPEFLPILQQRVGDAYITNLLQMNTKSEDLSVKTKVEPPKKLLTETDKKLILGDITKINSLVNKFGTISQSDASNILLLYNEIPNILNIINTLKDKVNQFSDVELKQILDKKHDLYQFTYHISDKDIKKNPLGVTIQNSLAEFIEEWKNDPGKNIILNAAKGNYPTVEQDVVSYSNKSLQDLLQNNINDIKNLINDIPIDKTGEEIGKKSLSDTDKSNLLDKINDIRGKITDLKYSNINDISGGFKMKDILDYGKPIADGIKKLIEELDTFSYNTKDVIDHLRDIPYSLLSTTGDGNNKVQLESHNTDHKSIRDFINGWDEYANTLKALYQIYEGTYPLQKVTLNYIQKDDMIKFLSSALQDIQDRIVDVSRDIFIRKEVYKLNKIISVLESMKSWEFKYTGGDHQRNMYIYDLNFMMKSGYPIVKTLNDLIEGIIPANEISTFATHDVEFYKVVVPKTGQITSQKNTKKLYWYNFFSWVRGLKTEELLDALNGNFTSDNPVVKHMITKNSMIEYLNSIIKDIIDYLYKKYPDSMKKFPITIHQATRKNVDDPNKHILDEFSIIEEMFDSFSDIINTEIQALNGSNQVKNKLFLDIIKFMKETGTQIVTQIDKLIKGIKSIPVEKIDEMKVIDRPITYYQVTANKDTSIEVTESPLNQSFSIFIDGWADNIISSDTLFKALNGEFPTNKDKVSGWVIGERFLVKYLKTIIMDIRKLYTNLPVRVKQEGYLDEAKFVTKYDDVTSTLDEISSQLRILKSEVKSPFINNIEMWKYEIEFTKTTGNDIVTRLNNLKIIPQENVKVKWTTVNVSKEKATDQLLIILNDLTSGYSWEDFYKKWEYAINYIHHLYNALNSTGPISPTSLSIVKKDDLIDYLEKIILDIQKILSRYKHLASNSLLELYEINIMLDNLQAEDKTVQGKNFDLKNEIKFMMNEGNNIVDKIDALINIFFPDKKIGKIPKGELKHFYVSYKKGVPLSEIQYENSQDFNWGDVYGFWKYNLAIIPSLLNAINNKFDAGSSEIKVSILQKNIMIPYLRSVTKEIKDKYISQIRQLQYTSKQDNYKKILTEFLESDEEIENLKKVTNDGFNDLKHEISYIHDYIIRLIDRPARLAEIIKLAYPDYEQTKHQIKSTHVVIENGKIEYRPAGLEIVSNPEKIKENYEKILEDLNKNLGKSEFDFYDGIMLVIYLENVMKEYAPYIDNIKNSAGAQQPVPVPPDNDKLKLLQKISVIYDSINEFKKNNRYENENFYLMSKGPQIVKEIKELINELKTFSPDMGDIIGKEDELKCCSYTIDKDASTKINKDTESCQMSLRKFIDEWDNQYRQGLSYLFNASSGKYPPNKVTGKCILKIPMADFLLSKLDDIKARINNGDIDINTVNEIENEINILKSNLHPKINVNYDLKGEYKNTIQFINKTGNDLVYRIKDIINKLFTPKQINEFPESRLQVDAVVVDVNNEMLSKTTYKNLGWHSFIGIWKKIISCLQDLSDALSRSGTGKQVTTFIIIKYRLIEYLQSVIQNIKLKIPPEAQTNNPPSMDELIQRLNLVEALLDEFERHKIVGSTQNDQTNNVIIFIISFCQEKFIKAMDDLLETMKKIYPQYGNDTYRLYYDEMRISNQNMRRISEYWQKYNMYSFQKFKDKWTTDILKSYRSIQLSLFNADIPGSVDYYTRSYLNAYFRKIVSHIRRKIEEYSGKKLFELGYTHTPPKSEDLIHLIDDIESYIYDFRNTPLKDDDIIYEINLIDRRFPKIITDIDWLINEIKKINRSYVTKKHALFYYSVNISNRKLELSINPRNDNYTFEKFQDDWDNIKQSNNNTYLALQSTTTNKFKFYARIQLIDYIQKVMKDIKDEYNRLYPTPKSTLDEFVKIENELNEFEKSKIQFTEDDEASLKAGYKLEISFMKGDGNDIVNRLNVLIKNRIPLTLVYDFAIEQVDVYDVSVIPDAGLKIKQSTTPMGWGQFFSKWNNIMSDIDLLCLAFDKSDLKDLVNQSVIRKDALIKYLKSVIRYIKKEISLPSKQNLPQTPLSDIPSKLQKIKIDLDNLAAKKFQDPDPGDGTDPMMDFSNAIVQDVNDLVEQPPFETPPIVQEYITEELTLEHLNNDKLFQKELSDSIKTIGDNINSFKEASLDGDDDISQKKSEIELIKSNCQPIIDAMNNIITKIKAMGIEYVSKKHKLDSEKLTIVNRQIILKNLNDPQKYTFDEFHQVWNNIKLDNANALQVLNKYKYGEATFEFCSRDNLVSFFEKIMKDINYAYRKSLNVGVDKLELIKRISNISDKIKKLGSEIITGSNAEEKMISEINIIFKNCPTIISDIEDIVNEILMADHSYNLDMYLNFDNIYIYKGKLDNNISGDTTKKSHKSFNIRNFEEMWDDVETINTRVLNSLMWKTDCTYKCYIYRRDTLFAFLNDTIKNIITKYHRLYPITLTEEQLGGNGKYNDLKNIIINYYLRLLLILLAKELNKYLTNKLASILRNIPNQTTQIDKTDYLTPLITLIQYKIGSLNNLDMQLLNYLKQLGLNDSTSLAIYLAQKKEDVEQIFSKYTLNYYPLLLNIMRFKKLSAERKFRTDYGISSDEQIQILLSKQHIW